MTPLSQDRWLGIDHGEARVGLAVSDALGFMAHPLETVPLAQSLRRIVEVVGARQITKIVIGLPYRRDGSAGPAVERVQAFIDKLVPLLPSSVKLETRDESYSTVTAHEHLRASGKKTKYHRPVIDQAAAVVILQEHLDAQNPAALLYPEVPLE